MGGHGASEMDHHHHGGRPYDLPDWRKYKVEDVPELLELQKKLAEKGLKDPWLRNEVWRYDPRFGTRGSRGRSVFLRGAKWGILAFALTIAGTKAYEMYSPSPPKEHGGDHGHR